MGKELLQQAPLEPGNRLLNRRTFTKALAASAAAYGVTKMLPGAETMKPCMSEGIQNPEISRLLLIIDFTPDDCDPSIAQDFKFTNDQLLDHLAKRFLESNNKQAFQTAYEALTKVGLGSLLKDKFLEYNPQFASAANRIDEVADHGKGVADVITRTLRERGIEITPTMYPIQRTYDQIRSSTDEEGNPVWLVGTSTGRIISGVRRYPDQEIVNLSWQVGEVGVVMKDSGELILGAYRKETAYENLSKLSEICNTFPEKLFVVAAGNNNDDLIEARKVLAEEGKWPENVIVVGEWVPSGEKSIFDGEPLYSPNSVYGADMYVKNDGFWGGSTVSTAIISATAVYLRSRGFTIPQVKKIILDLCYTEEIYSHPDGTEYPITVYPVDTKIYDPNKLTMFMNSSILQDIYRGNLPQLSNTDINDVIQQIHEFQTKIPLTPPRRK